MAHSPPDYVSLHPGYKTFFRPSRPVSTIRPRPQTKNTPKNNARTKGQYPQLVSIVILFTNGTHTVYGEQNNENFPIKQNYARGDGRRYIDRCDYAGLGSGIKYHQPGANADYTGAGDHANA